MKTTLFVVCFVLVCAASFAKKDQKAFDQQNDVAMAALLKIRKIYVLDPQWLGYGLPRHLAKQIETSDCLVLEPDASHADAVLAPVGRKKGIARVLDNQPRSSLIRCGGGAGCSVSEVGSGPGAWVLVDPITGNQISDWSMDAFPNSKKIERAVGCSE